MNDFPDDFDMEPFETPQIYELRINGRLDQDLAAWFEDMTLMVDENASPLQTIIRGAIRDQAALYGLISRIRDLGLLLVSVNQIGEEEEANGETEDDKRA